MTLTTLLFLIVGIFAATSTLAVGFGAGFFCATRIKVPVQDRPAALQPAESEMVVALKRVQMASDSLAHLAQSMVSNVAAHSNKIEEISTTISSGESSGARIALVPELILAVNLELQNQLDKAKQQIENQARELRARESEARTDLLTSLLNRRAFNEEVRRQLADWERNRRPFSLIMLDVDLFKRFNDTHGHQSGDIVLREVAQKIVAQLRPMDAAFRYGGEEFAVLLPGTEGEHAIVVGERIREAIENATILHDTKRLKVTASIGLTGVLPNDTYELLVQRADQALYKSKKAGRNRLHLYEACIQKGSNESAGLQSENVENPFSCKLLSIAAFNRELTKQVCTSRRTGNSLSLVQLQFQFAIDEKLNLDAFTTFINQHLSRSDVLSLGERGEAWLILPDRDLAKANELLSQIETNSCVVGAASQLRHEETAEDLMSRTVVEAALI